MANYYLDIETTALDSNKDKIITIPFQKAHSATIKASMRPITTRWTENGYSKKSWYFDITIDRDSIRIAPIKRLL